MVNWLDCIFIVVVIFSSIFFLNGSCDTSINLPLSDPASCYGPLKDQFSSVTQSCLSLCNPMDCCMPVHHQLLESTKTHVLWVSVAIQPSHPLKDQAWINPGNKVLLLSIMKRKIKDSLLPSVERLRLTSLWLGFNLFSMEYLDVIAILHFN